MELIEKKNMIDSNIKIINRFGVLIKLSSMQKLWSDIPKEKDLDKLDGMCIRSIINSKYKYCRFDNIFKSDSAFYNNMKKYFVGTMKLDYLREMK